MFVILTQVELHGGETVKRMVNLKIIHQVVEVKKHEFYPTANTMIVVSTPGSGFFCKETLPEIVKILEELD